MSLKIGHMHSRKETSKFGLYFSHRNCLVKYTIKVSLIKWHHVYIKLTLFLLVALAMKNNHADLASSAHNSVENNGEIYAIFSTLKCGEFSLQLPPSFLHKKMYNLAVFTTELPPQDANTGC